MGKNATPLVYQFLTFLYIDPLVLKTFPRHVGTSPDPSGCLPTLKKTQKTKNPKNAKEPGKIAKIERKRKFTQDSY